jgi:hypothetical protein
VPNLTASIAALDARIETTSDPEARHMLALLRDKSVGEAIGDLELTLSTLSPAFEMTSRTPGAPEVTASGAPLRAGLERLCHGDTVVWVEWEHLLLDGSAVMGDGQLFAFSPEPDGSWTVTASAIVVVLEFEDGLITREVVYRDPAAALTEKLQSSALSPRVELAERYGAPAPAPGKPTA